MAMAGVRGWRFRKTSFVGKYTADRKGMWADGWRTGGDDGYIYRNQKGLSTSEGFLQISF